MRNKTTVQLEAELKEARASERRWRLLIEQSGDTIAMVAADGVILYESPAIERVLGYTPEELQGKNAFDLLHPDDREIAACYFGEVLAQPGKPVISQARFIRKDGTSCWIEATNVNQLDNPDFNAVVSNFRDITDRKRVEEALEHTHNTLAEVQKIARLGSFEYIAATQVTVWSEEEYRIYGLDPAGPSPTYAVMLQKCIHPDDADLLHKTFTQAMESRSIYELEHRIVMPNGSVRWVYDRAHPYLNKQGELERYLGTTLDITERKHAEKKLRAAERKYHIVADNTSDWEFWLSPKGKSIYMSPSCEKVTGYSNMEFIKDRGLLEQIIHPDDLHIYREHLKDIVREKNQHLIEFRIQHRNGEWKWIEHVCHPIFDDDHKFLGMRGSNRDVTERKLSVDKLRESEMQLKALVTSLDDIVFEVDEHGTYLNVWTANESLLFAPREQIIGRRFDELFGAEASRLFFEYLERCLQSSEVQNLEYPVNLAGGTRWFSARYTPILSENKTRKTVSIMVRDISARKQVLEKLKESEARSTAMLNAVPDMMFRLNREGIFLDYKSDVSDLYAQSKATIIGRRNREIAPPEFADLIEQKIQAALESGSLQTFEYQLPIPNQGLQCYEARMAPSGTDEVTAIVRNITDRKTYDLALLEKLKLQEQLEKTATIVPGMIHVFKRDVEGKLSIPYTSPMIKDIYGVNPEDVVADAQPIFVHIDPQDLPRIEASVAESAQMMTPWWQEFRYHHPQKGLRWFEGHSTPVRDADGSILWYGIVQDVTARKQAEEKLRASEQHFSIIFENSPVPNAIVRLRDSHLLEVNRAWMNLWSFEKQEVIHKTAVEIGLWANPDDRVRMVEELGKTSHITEFEARLRSRSRGERIALISAGQVIINGEDCLIMQTVDVTERHALEDSLRESNLRFEQITTHVPEVFWMFDNRAMKMDYVSPAYETIYRRSIANLYEDPRQYVEAIHPDDRGVMFAALEKQGRGESTEMEYRIMLPDGTIRWIYDRSSPIFDDHGQLLHTTGIATDITERKRNEALIYAQRDLARAIGHYHTVLEGFSSFLETIITLSGMDSGGVYLFDEKYQNMDLIFHQGLGKSFAESVSHFTADAPQAKMILAGKSLYFSADHPIVQHPMHQAEGLRSLASVPVLYQERVIGCINLGSHTLNDMPVFARHVFETLAVEIGNFVVRLRNEEALRASEEKYRVLSQELEERVKDRTAELSAIHERLELATQAAELGVWEWNVQTNQLYWDDQMFKISRVDKTNFNSTLEASTSRIHPEDVGGVIQKMQEMLAGKLSQGQIEYRIMRGDGSIGYLKTHGIAQWNSQNQIEYIIGMVQDVTQEKLAENALRESYSQLNIANIALEKALRVKDEFLASMSHELRTPLTGILGLSEALQLSTYGKLTEKQQKAIKTIAESGNHLLALINDILDLSKIEAGKLEIQTAICSLADICQSSLQLTKGMAHQKRQHVKYSMPIESILLDVDMRRVKQIIVNLLSNAIKFTPENGELGLTVEPDEANHQVRLIVWDKGIGVKAEQLPKLFQPFTQIDSSLAREYSGTGLGLSLVMRLTELHHGIVTVESVFGEGSRFIVTLPWVVQTEEDPSQTSRSDSAAYIQPAVETVQSKLILITDDNALLLDMLADFLEAQNYRTAKIYNGKEFLEKVETLRPDLILMDIQMPGMDGLEVTRRLRKHKDPAIADIPVIAVTALAMTGDRERCLAAGANEYVSKPVKLIELIQVIHNQIRNDDE